MTSHKKVVFLVLLSSLALTAANPSQAQQRSTLSFPKPSYTPPPAPRPAPQPQYHSAPQQQTRSAPEPQNHPAPQPTPQRQPQPAAQPQSRTSSAPTQKPAQPREQARQPEAQPKQQQKERANQQKEQQKQQQTGQKEQARQQMEQKKQQQKQQKEQQKKLQKQQKEEARRQKEVQKEQKNKKGTGPSPASSNSSPTPRSSSTSTAKGAATGAASGKMRKDSVLTPRESQAAIRRINSARSSMSGINRRPLPAGDVTLHSNGRMTLKAADGRQYGVRANGTIASYSNREKTVSFDKRGKISSIHTATLDVHHGANGQRTIVSRRADGSKVVSTGMHSGYVERSAVANNRTYIQRTTVMNQRVYTSTFVANGHGSLVLAGFVPPVYFAPGFYGWAYYPWTAPIAFRWGWFGSPWYLGPNPYFVASSLYPSAAFWLTDYMIGETLATAYQLDHDSAMLDENADVADSYAADMSVDDSDSSSGQAETIQAEETTPITPEIKAAIAEEVKQELANDNAQSANPSQASFDVLPSVLRTPNHVFVVSNDLDVTTTDQQLCGLQAGDMLQLISAAASDSSFAQLRVASSKRRDCPAGTVVSLSLPDLQEMQNNFQAQVESGLGLLRNEQGRDGLPGAPPDVVAAPPRPVMAGLVPLSAADSSAMLDQQKAQADQVEAQAVTLAF